MCHRRRHCQCGLARGDAVVDFAWATDFAVLRAEANDVAEFTQNLQLGEFCVEIAKLHRVEQPRGGLFRVCVEIFPSNVPKLVCTAVIDFCRTNGSTNGANRLRLTPKVVNIILYRLALKILLVSNSCAMRKTSGVSRLTAPCVRGLQHHDPRVTCRRQSSRCSRQRHE